MTRWAHAAASKRSARNRAAVVRRARAWSLEGTHFRILPQELITMIYRQVDVIRQQAANLITRRWHEKRLRDMTNPFRPFMGVPPEDEDL